MKKIIFAATLAALCATAVPAIVSAQAASTAAAAKPYYTVEDSTIGDLMANPVTKAILVKYIPDVVNNPQIDQAAAMTLKAVQQYAPDKLSDDVLAKIDAELATVPAPKS